MSWGPGGVPLTGRTISQHDRETRALPPRYDALTIGLTFRERADLWARIDRRVDQMARDGLEAEVRGLLSSGLPRTCTAMQAIGYKEFVAAVDGQISWKEAEELVKLRSRQYAKRQLTWFRRREGTQWITWEKEPDFGTARRRSTEFIREIYYTEGDWRNAYHDVRNFLRKWPDEKGSADIYIGSYEGRSAEAGSFGYLLY